MTTVGRLAATLSAAILAGSAFMAAPAANALPHAASNTDQRQASSVTPTDANSTNADLVAAWYGDFLGRVPDDGARHWVGQLDAGAQRGDVLWAITHSREFHESEITNDYYAILRRAPDSGAAYWINGASANQFPDEWVRQNLLASSEYFRTSGSTNAAVLGWYSELLNREPMRVSNGELSYWRGRIDKIGRLGALREMYYSSDAVNTRINLYYEYLLGREADGGGLAYWYPKEVESDINVAVLIASTEEYRLRIGNDNELD